MISLRFGVIGSAGGPALSELGGVAAWRKFAPRQIVLAVGKPARKVFFIGAGGMRSISRSRGEPEIILDEIGPGHFLSEISVMDCGPRAVGVPCFYGSRDLAMEWTFEESFGVVTKPRRSRSSS